MTPEDAQKLTDEQLFDAIRQQVNLSRVTNNHNRKATRIIAAEAARRGWNLRQPSETKP